MRMVDGMPDERAAPWLIIAFRVVSSSRMVTIEQQDLSAGRHQQVQRERAPNYRKQNACFDTSRSILDFRMGKHYWYDHPSRQEYL